MWLDILNKPKQRKAFNLFRDNLMNVTDYYDNEVEQVNTHPYLVTEKERVRYNSEVLRKIT